MLEYMLVKRSDGASLLEVRLHTGRYHQIRVQLAEAGVPILGDRRYGGPPAGLPRGTIALHHILMELEHPVRREPVRIEAPYPPHWPLV
jgi:23S rRNA pseudouridine1911/1915/1917 synthase